MHSQCHAKAAAQSCPSCFLRVAQHYWRSSWPPQPCHSVFVLLTNGRPAAMRACSAKAQCLPGGSPAKRHIRCCLHAPHATILNAFNIQVLFCKQLCLMRLRSAQRASASSGVLQPRRPSHLSSQPDTPSLYLMVTTAVSMPSRRAPACRSLPFQNAAR